MTIILMIIQLIINKIKTHGSSKSLNLSLSPSMDMMTIIPIEPILRLIPKDQNFKTLPMTKPKIESMITLMIKSNSNQTTVPVINTPISKDQ